MGFRRRRAAAQTTDTRILRLLRLAQRRPCALAARAALQVGPERGLRHGGTPCTRPGLHGGARRRRGALRRDPPGLRATLRHGLAAATGRRAARMGRCRRSVLGERRCVPSKTTPPASSRRGCRSSRTPCAAARTIRAPSRWASCTTGRGSRGPPPCAHWSNIEARPSSTKTVTHRSPTNPRATTSCRRASRKQTFCGRFPAARRLPDLARRPPRRLRPATGHGRRPGRRPPGAPRRTEPEPRLDARGHRFRRAVSAPRSDGRAAPHGRTGIARRPDLRRGPTGSRPSWAISSPGGGWTADAYAEKQRATRAASSSSTPACSANSDHRPITAMTSSAQRRTSGLPSPKTRPARRQRPWRRRRGFVPEAGGVVLADGEARRQVVRR